MVQYVHYLEPIFLPDKWLYHHGSLQPFRLSMLLHHWCEDLSLSDKKAKKFNQQNGNSSPTDEQRAAQCGWKVIFNTEPGVHCAALIKAFSIHSLS